MVAAVLNPELGQLEVALLVHRHRHLRLQLRLVPEQEIQLHQRLLAQRMARHDVLLRRRAHHVGHVIGESGGNLQQPRLSRGAVIVDRRLDHRAGVIDIVLQVVVAAVQAPAMPRLLQLGVSVQVAVRDPWPPAAAMRSM